MYTKDNSVTGGNRPLTSRRVGVGPAAAGVTDRDRRRRHALVVALTFVTGSADAMGFLALGGAFSSVMTGNMVLLGLSGGRLDGELAVTSGCAIVSFIAGVLGGARVAGSPRSNDPAWPWPVTRALILELAVFVGYLVAWELTVGERSAGLQLGMLMVSAVALGIQSSAVQRLGVSGLSSTYLTGTLTNLVGDLAARSPWPVLRPRLQILLALMTGAAVGAVLAVQLPWLAPVLLVVPLAGVIVLSRWPRTR
jgi:uncharacterized membrane protein YoaK (UPF0700 family)